MGRLALRSRGNGLMTRKNEQPSCHIHSPDATATIPNSSRASNRLIAAGAVGSEAHQARARGEGEAPNWLGQLLVCVPQRSRAARCLSSGHTGACVRACERGQRADRTESAQKRGAYWRRRVTSARGGTQCRTTHSSVGLPLSPPSARERERQQHTHSPNSHAPPAPPAGWPLHRGPTLCGRPARRHRHGGRAARPGEAGGGHPHWGTAG